MAAILDNALPILGVLLVIAGAVTLGATIGRLQKARGESADGVVVEPDSQLLGAAIALTGAGTALLSVGLV